MLTVLKKTLYFRHRPAGAPLLACTLAVSCLLPATVMAADNPGAHEHGQAQIQIALEDKRIDLLFVSPAYNLAGFEYEARTKAERKQLAGIKRWLETTPLVNTANGDCRIDTASVSLGGESNSDHGHGHEHHDKKHAHHEEHRDHHDEQTPHRDYEVTQQLNCAEFNAGDTFTSALIDRFPEIETLRVEWVSAIGQGSSVLDASTRTFALDQ